MVAARTGQLNFLGVIAAEEALLGLAPGTISGTLAPSAAGTGVDTAAADAAAAQGQFIPIDVQFGAGGVIGAAAADGASNATGVLNASPADVAFLTHANVATPQQTSSVLDPSRVGADRFVSIAEEDVFTAQTTLTSILFASNPFVTTMGADQGVVITEIGMVYLPGVSTETALAASGTSGLVNGLAASTYKLSPELESATHYATKFSWGAQGRIGLTYNRAFGTPINLSPVFNCRFEFRAQLVGAGSKPVDQPARARCGQCRLGADARQVHHADFRDHDTLIRTHCRHKRIGREQDRGNGGLRGEDIFLGDGIEPVRPDPGGIEHR